MAEDRRGGFVSRAMTAEAWMQEALTTKADARTGVLQGFTLQNNGLQEPMHVSSLHILATFGQSA